jgi:hypothetical protein
MMLGLVRLPSVQAASLSLSQPMDPHRQYASAAIRPGSDQTVWSFGETKMSAVTSESDSKPWTKKQWLIFGGVVVAVGVLIAVIASNSGGGGGSSGSGGGY